jgi:hypothetical protein
MGKKSKTISVPVGLEQLLLAAASDRELRAALICDRGDVAARLGLALTRSERAVLAIAPAAAPETDAPFEGPARIVTPARQVEIPDPGLNNEGGARPDAGDQPLETPEIELLNPELMTSGGARPRVDVDNPKPNTGGGVRPGIEDEPHAFPEVEIDDPKMMLDGGARPDIE